VPLADGGEGTVDAAIAAGAEERYTRVTGPLGQPIWARWGVFRSPDGSATTAVLESAQASGLNKITPNRTAARAAHSYGCGQLVRAALDLGAIEDRKSTRLNSSHVSISYAVFCLKKKKNKHWR